MIRRGYRLPFAQYPSQCFLKNNRSALQHPEFVAEAITELLSNGCIVEHVASPFCVNPITVAEGKKLRLVIDLRHVDNCLVKPRFKYEDLRSLSQVLDEGFGWKFFTWDLKSGYHHVDICLDHQKYLGFAWPFSGVVRYFTFAVLPFGLGSACFCFTKLMRPLVRSHWTPTEIGQWLGFVIDSISLSFRIPEKKVSKLKGLLDSAIQAGYSSFRELARITGTIIPVALAVGPIFVFWPGRCTSPLKPGQHGTTPFIFLPVFYSSSNFGTATSIASTVIL